MVIDDNCEDFDDDTDVLFIEMETVAFTTTAIIFILITSIKTCVSYVKNYLINK